MKVQPARGASNNKSMAYNNSRPSHKSTTPNATAATQQGVPLTARSP
jgi:hypothetical protein